MRRFNSLFNLLLVFFLTLGVSFADTKISQLGSNASPASSDEIPHNASGTTKKFTLGTLDTYFSSTTKTLTNKTISGASNNLTVRLGSDVSGTLPIANGGTGQTTQAGALSAILPSLSAAKYLYTDGTTVSWQSGGGAVNFAALSDYTSSLNGTISQTGSWAFTASTQPSGGTIVALYSVQKMGQMALLTYYINMTGVTNIASANPTKLVFDLPVGAPSAVDPTGATATQMLYAGGGNVITGGGTTGAARTYLYKNGGVYQVRAEFTATTNISVIAGQLIYGCS